MDLRVEPTGKRIRCLLGGHVVVDTVRAQLVWERPFYPTYFVPRDDVAAELADAGNGDEVEGLGTRRDLDLTAGGRTVVAAARRYERSDGALDGLVAFTWAAMDAWFEEDEQVYVHARDPYTRVDVLDSSRHVVVAVDGLIVADSHHPTLLFETGLPTRYYLPKTDVRIDLLTPTDTVTRCPYKGEATEWWSLEVGGAVHRDLAWCYPFPVAESAEIAGRVCFFNERVDLTLDGVAQERPVTHFA